MNQDESKIQNLKINEIIKRVHPPDGLQDFQKAFSKTMSQPFLFNNKEKQSFQYQKDKYATEIVELMEDRQDLKGIDRLSTYNQQYWFRLLTSMQGLYPVLVQHLGLYCFNQLVTAYLVVHPSKSPSLDQLDDEFPQFILNGHHRWQNENTLLYFDMVSLDFIFSKAFVSMQKESLITSSLTAEQVGALAQEPLPFQPSFHLFKSDWNILECRRIVIRNNSNKDSGQNSNQEALPIKKETCQLAVYRKNNQLFIEELHPLAFNLIENLFQGTSLSDALGELSEKVSEAELAYLSSNIQSWFQKWSQLGWFASK